MTNVDHLHMRHPTGVYRRAIGKTVTMTEPRNYDLAARMAELARTAAAPRSVDEVLSM